MTAHGVTVRADGPVTEVIVGHGTRRNAMSGADWRTLRGCLDRVGSDPGTRAVILRGHGDTFSAGSDMTEWTDADPDTVEEAFRSMEEAFRAVERCQVPVLAQISGVAAGAGCQLALACDLRLMADTARIGMPIARLGILASPSFAARLVTLAGPGTARRLLYTGELVGGPAAVRLGLAEEVVPQAELPARVREIAARIGQQPPSAIRAAKHSVARALLPVREATEDNPHPAVSLPDLRAGVSAFLRRSSA